MHPLSTTLKLQAKEKKMETTKPFPTLTAVALAAALCVHGIAAAQPVRPATAPETTATQREEGEQPKQELPMTREVTGRQALQQTQGGYQDVTRTQASVTPASPEGGSAPLFNIRGIRVNPQSNFRLDGGVAVTAVQSMPTENKERIETLKGANALMFGIASPSGIINMIPKRAGERDVTSVAMSATRFGQFGAHLDVGRRFGEQKQVGVRANVSGVRAKNGVHDLDGHGKFASLGLDWRATSRLLLQGDFEYYTRDTSEQPQIALAAPVNGVVPITRVPDPRKNLLGPGGDWAEYKPRSRNYQVRADYQITTGWKALAQFGKSDTHRDREAIRIAGYNLLTGANGVVTDQVTSNDNDNTFWRTELMGDFLTGPFAHHLTVGLSTSERSSASTNLVVTLPQRQNIYNPVTIPEPRITQAPRRNPDQNSKDEGVYVYDTVTVLPQVKVLAGVRFTKTTESAAGQPDTSSRTTSPALGVLYELRPTTTLFASYMSGLEAGQQAPGQAANAGVILSPAESKQKEIGIRDTSIRGLSWSASYFDIDRANAVIDPTTGNFGYNGRLRYKGVEATARYEFMQRWLLSGALQHLRAEQIAPTDATINGKTPENTPKWTANVSLGYRTPWVPGLQLRVGANTISRRAVNPQGQGHLPGYTLFNAGAAYTTKVAGRNTTLQLAVDNLANRRYWNSVANGLYGSGMNRNVRVSARMEF